MGHVVAGKVAHETVPRMSGIGIDGRVLAFNIGASLLTGILSASRPLCAFPKRICRRR